MEDKVFYYSIAILILISVIISLIPKLKNSHKSESEESKLKTRQLYFITGLLGILGLVFLQGMIMYYFSCNEGLCNKDIDNPGKVIFEAIVQIIPPLITLILGYYFGIKTKLKRKKKKKD